MTLDMGTLCLTSWGTSKLFSKVAVPFYSFLDMTLKAQVTKEKINRTSSKLKTLSLKGHHREGETSTHKVGENICKLYTWERTLCYNSFLGLL